MNPKNERWFEECFDAVRQFMGILDSNGKIMRVNRAAFEFTGLTQSELTGSFLWMIPWPVLKSQNRQALKRAITQAITGISTRNEIEIRQRNQPEKIIEFSIRPIRDETGALDFMLAEARDITAYRRTREALFQSEARF